METKMLWFLQRSKYLQSFKTNSYPIVLRKQGYRFDIKGLKVAK